MWSEPTSVLLYTRKCRADDRPPPHPSFFMFPTCPLDFVGVRALYIWVTYLCTKGMFLLFFVSLSQPCWDLSVMHNLPKVHN